MKLAVFDFDSTLMDGETIDFLAQSLGVKKQVSSLTKEAMDGKLDFFESLIQRVKLLKGLKHKDAVDICKNLPLMNGAVQSVNKLKEKGYKVVCFSGGFTIATNAAKDKLNLDATFSNILHEKNGILTGLVGGDMMFSSSKGDMIQKLQALLNITIEDTLVVGDGANDLSMFKYAKQRIAFCAKNILRNEANIIIDEKDLSIMLKYI